MTSKRRKLKKRIDYYKGQISSQRWEDDGPQMSAGGFIDPQDRVDKLTAELQALDLKIRNLQDKLVNK